MRGRYLGLCDPLYLWLHRGKYTGVNSHDILQYHKKLWIDVLYNPGIGVKSRAILAADTQASSGMVAGSSQPLVWIISRICSL